MGVITWNKSVWICVLGVKLRKPSGADRSAGLVLTTRCALLLTLPIRPTKDQQPSLFPVMWTKSLSVCGLYSLKRMVVLSWKSSMTSWILFRSLAAAQETDQCQFMIIWCNSRRWKFHFVVWETRGLVIKFPDWVPKVPFGFTAVHRAELWTCTPVNPSHGSVRFCPVSCPKNTNR